jgi:hypothetical protein
MQLNKKQESHTFMKDNADLENIISNGIKYGKN